LHPLAGDLESGAPDVPGGTVRHRDLTFVFAWNDFIFALVLTRTEVATYTVQVTHYFGGQSNFWAKISAIVGAGNGADLHRGSFMQRTS